MRLPLVSATVVAALALVAACRSTTTPPAASPGPQAAAPQASTPFEQDLVAALDTTTDPCTDFYQYACGGWLEANPIPADKVYVNRSFDTIAERNRELLREVAESSSTSDDPTLAKVGTVYEACMDEAAIEARGRDALEPLVSLLDGLKDRSRGLSALHAAGVGGIFSASITADSRDPSVQVVRMGQNGMILGDKSMYLDPARAEILAAYETWLVTVFGLEGHDESKAQALATAVLDFEKALAEVSWDRSQLYDSLATYNPHTLDELKSLAPRIDWDAYFTAMGITGLDRVIVATPSYFEAMDDLLAEVDADTLRAAMHARILASYGSNLSSPYVEADFAFFGKVLRGQEAIEPRWKRCLRTTGAVMGEALGQAYVERAFTGDSKQVARDTVTFVQTAFGSRLDDADWMDAETREVAKDKAAKLVRKIGYPDKWRDYSALEVTDDHFGNLMAANAFELKRELARLGKPTDKQEWFMPPQAVNAYYNPEFNEIVFPAGILQPPFFSAEFPAAANFGAIGMVIGHEVSHAFDDDGRRYSVEGKLEDWWTEASSEAFDERAECLDELYSGIEVLDGEFINGELTLGENIADLGGVRVALEAHRAWELAAGKTPPAAGFSGDQLVFLSFAQAWCTNITPRTESMRLVMDSHSPAKYRVNVPLQSLPEFAEAFECAAGTPMNPAERCEVW